MLECNRVVLEGVDAVTLGTVSDSELIGRVVIEEGAEVVSSRIVGPAVIGSGARIVNSYVGPFTAIGPDCVLSDTEIEYSIVLADSTITGIRRIEGSLIGREVEVRPAAGPLQSYRLCLGDHSMVQIP
jgi:glucose-1-phosphate thymidylyltransferase